MSFGQSEIDTLAAKLDALVLTSAERAALDALFEAAAAASAPEVAGFAVDPPDASSRYANQEVSYFRPRLIEVLGSYIGETEKNLD